ncbi:hypothetical protein [Pengzhenrongella sp.]|jgi:hypothetical protein|uniref:hypothetical protein n=1 Tax=Pengzhenrongella sp. TaxID=2888820 RepID=UPI002F95E59F
MQGGEHLAQQDVEIEHPVRRRPRVDRTALPIAGDDDAAKQAVVRFLDAIGYDSLDLGPLAEGWRTEPGTPLAVAPYFRDPTPASTHPYQRFLDAETVPVPIEDARRLAQAATRA